MLHCSARQHFTHTHASSHSRVPHSLFNASLSRLLFMKIRMCHLSILALFALRWTRKHIACQEASYSPSCTLLAQILRGLSKSKAENMLGHSNGGRVHGRQEPLFPRAAGSTADIRPPGRATDGGADREAHGEAIAGGRLAGELDCVAAQTAHELDLRTVFQPEG